MFNNWLLLPMVFNTYSGPQDFWNSELIDPATTKNKTPAATMPLTGCFLHESHQPSAISTQLRAFMLRCVRQDMWVIKKVLDITVSHIYRDSGISYNILKHKNVQARSSLKGNPVKIRNGPAAVIGDEHRIMSLRPTGCGKARLLERSESQKTCLNRMWLFIRH